LSAAADELNKKVKRIHIETHNREVEAGLRQLFGDLGWKKVYDYPCSLDYPNYLYHETDWGVIPFHGGVQTWLNLNFANPELARAHGEIRQLRAQIKQVQSEGTALQQQLAAREEEVQTLRAEKDELASTLRLIEFGGLAVAEALATAARSPGPGRHRRRRLYDSVVKPLRGSGQSHTGKGSRFTEPAGLSSHLRCILRRSGMTNHIRSCLRNGECSGELSSLSLPFLACALAAAPLKPAGRPRPAPEPGRAGGRSGGHRPRLGG
jgi:regulator of replication initiation timing